MTLPPPPPPPSLFSLSLVLYTMTLPPPPPPPSLFSLSLVLYTMTLPPPPPPPHPGLPATSIALDETRIYWTREGSGVFYVTREDRTILTHVAGGSNASAIITLSPGQQPLPSEFGCILTELFRYINSPLADTSPPLPHVREGFRSQTNPPGLTLTPPKQNSHSISPLWRRLWAIEHQESTTATMRRNVTDRRTQTPIETVLTLYACTVYTQSCTCTCVTGFDKVFYSTKVLWYMYMYMYVKVEAFHAFIDHSFRLGHDDN